MLFPRKFLSSVSRGGVLFGELNHGGGKAVFEGTSVKKEGEQLRRSIVPDYAGPLGELKPPPLVIRSLRSLQRVAWPGEISPPHPRHPHPPRSNCKKPNHSLYNVTKPMCVWGVSSVTLQRTRNCATEQLRPAPWRCLHRANGQEYVPDHGIQARNIERTLRSISSPCSRITICSSSFF